MQLPNMEVIKAFDRDEELTEQRIQAWTVIESGVMIPIADIT